MADEYDPSYILGKNRRTGFTEMFHPSVLEFAAYSLEAYDFYKRINGTLRKLREGNDEEEPKTNFPVYDGPRFSEALLNK